MGSVRLCMGTEWLLDERAFRIVRQLGATQFVAEDLKFGLERTFHESEILQLYVEGRLRLATTECDGASKSDNMPPWPPVILEPSQSQEAEERWRAIEPLAALESTPGNRDYQGRAAELTNSGN